MDSQHLGLLCCSLLCPAALKRRQGGEMVPIPGEEVGNKGLLLGMSSGVVCNTCRRAKIEGESRVDGEVLPGNLLA